MNRKTFKSPLVLYLSIALPLGMTLLAVIVRIASPDYAGKAFSTEIAMTGLAEQINAVGLVSVTSVDGSLIMTRDDDGIWALDERDGYPADTRKVQETVLALSRLLLQDRKTADATRYHRLDLNDPVSGSIGSSGTGIRLFIATEDGTTLVDAVVGKRVLAQSGLPNGGVYLRLGDDEQTWLAAGDLKLGVGLKDWIDTAIVDVGPDRISRVTVFHGDGEIVALERSGDIHVLLDIPDGYKLDSDYRLSSIPSFLVGLNIDDVQTAPETLGQALVTAAFETTDGLRVDVDLFGDEEAGHWLRFDASGQSDETRAEATRLKARTHGWLFKIADWKSGTLKHRMNDLIAPIMTGETQ